MVCHWSGAHQEESGVGFQVEGGRGWQVAVANGTGHVMHLFKPREIFAGILSTALSDQWFKLLKDQSPPVLGWKMDRRGAQRRRRWWGFYPICSIQACDSGSQAET